MTKEGPLCCNTSFSHSKDKPEKPVQQAEDAAYLRRRRIVSLISLIGFVIFSIVFAATIGQKLIEFLADGKAFRAWVEQQGILGPLTLVGIMVLQVVIAIIPGEAVEIGAGYAWRNPRHASLFGRRGVGFRDHLWFDETVRHPDGRGLRFA